MVVSVACEDSIILVVSIVVEAVAVVFVEKEVSLVLSLFLLLQDEKKNADKIISKKIIVLSLVIKIPFLLLIITYDIIVNE